MGSGAYAPAPLVAAGLGLPEEHHLDVLTTRARRRQRLAEDPLVVHEVPYLHYRRVGARVAVDAALIAIAGGPERVVAEAPLGGVLANTPGHVLVRGVHAVGLVVAGVALRRVGATAGPYVLVATVPGDTVSALLVPQRSGQQDGSSHTYPPSSGGRGRRMYPPCYQRRRHDRGLTHGTCPVWASFSLPS